jgi:uncharacterized phage infection (PIP) family protein YhgE
MGDMVIRDAAAMERFASQLDEYQTNMRTACQGIKSAASDAQQFMKDSSGTQALQRIDQLMAEMLSGLPAAAELVLKLQKSAGAINEATSIRF